MVLNIAHRGGAGLAPENTVSCFNQGIKYADMLEFDVQPSSDHHLMVFHDRQHVLHDVRYWGKTFAFSYHFGVFYGRKTIRQNIMLHFTTF